MSTSDQHHPQRPSPQPAPVRPVPTQPLRLAHTPAGGKGMSSFQLWSLALRRTGQALRSRATRKALPSLATDRTVLLLLVVTGVFFTGGLLLGAPLLAAMAAALTGVAAVDVLQHAATLRGCEVFSARCGAYSASWALDASTPGHWKGHGLTASKGSGLGMALLDEVRRTAPRGTIVSFRAANAGLAAHYRKRGFVDAPRGSGRLAKLADRLWPPLMWTAP